MKRSEIDHFGTSCAEFPPREMAAILHLSNHCVCSSRFFHNDITLDSKLSASGKLPRHTATFAAWYVQLGVVFKQGTHMAHMARMQGTPARHTCNNRDERGSVYTA
eukprot:scaffold68302_cov20-Tisochrysis_lutea.AAC.1